MNVYNEVIRHYKHGHLYKIDLQFDSAASTSLRRPSGRRSSKVYILTNMKNDGMKCIRMKAHAGNQALQNCKPV